MDDLRTGAAPAQPAPRAEDDEPITTSPYPTPRSWLKRALPQTLFGRSLMIVVTPLILTQLVSTWVFYDRHWDTLSRRLAEGLAGDVRVMVELWRDLPAEHAQPSLDRAAQAMWLNVRFVPGDTLGLAPGETDIVGDNSLARVLARAIDQRTDLPFRLSVGWFDRDAFVDVQLEDGVMYMIAPRERLFSPTTYIFLMWMIGSSLVLFAVAIIFMRNQVRPVHRLAKAADAFGRGVDVPNFKPEGGTEVRRAAVAFNVMRARIKRQIRQRTDMLSGVSHDLRTPLTRMKLQLEMMDADEDTRALRGDIAEMETMIEGYLAFARGEGGETAVDTDLGALLADVVDNARREAADAETPLALTLTGALDGPPIRLRAAAIRRAVSNLVSNARRHAGTVAVALRRSAAGVDILVDDDGPGVPEDKRSEVFRPFVRLDASRNPRTGGVGLGLAIARDAARAHGGDIRLEDSPLGGLRARLTLPIPKA